MTETKEQTKKDAKLQRRRASLMGKVRNCEDGTAEKLEQMYGLDIAEKLVQKSLSRPADVVRACNIRFMSSRRLIEYLAENNLSDEVVAKATRTTVKEVAASRASVGTESPVQEEPAVKKLKDDAKEKEKRFSQRVDNKDKKKQQQHVSDEALKRTEQVNSRIDSRTNQQQTQLSNEERKKIVANLAEDMAPEIVARQGEKLAEIVRELQKQPKRKREKYFYEKYGKGKVIDERSGSYCLAIQNCAMRLATDELLGEETYKDLKNFYDEPNKYQMVGDDDVSDNTIEKLRCDTDTISNGTLMAEQKAFIDKENKSMSSFINGDGTVKKDKNGKPLLNDGDLMLVYVGRRSNSGYHAIRINVDKQGKVTYTAGNNEHINANVLHDYRKGRIFRTSDFVKHTIEENLTKLPDEELVKLNSENKEKRYQAYASVSSIVAKDLQEREAAFKKELSPVLYATKQNVR